VVAGLTPTQQEMDGRDWSFGGTWPYEPRWLFTDGIRLHYVDEGPRDGESVVLLHGSPGWLYAYRLVIPALADAGFRTIAYDQLGFGRSDKPEKEGEYSLDRHVRHLDALVTHLELGEAGDISFVSQGSGLVIASAWAAGRSVARAAHVPAARLSRVLRTPVLGRFLVKGSRLPIRTAELSEDERAAFLAPHPSWASRSGIYVSLRETPYVALGTVDPAEVLEDLSQRWLEEMLQE